MRRTILICLVLIAIVLVAMLLVGLLWPEPLPTFGRAMTTEHGEMAPA